ncbi:VanZ family protein [Promicromonospora vindobonensis]|uniref:VanZ family protein n=1 Tax=Promicromonospora vindobonensis TaxID=195748 RepID=A0ABW5VXV1_9MICO
MSHDAPPAEPAPTARWPVLAGLAVLGLAIVLFFPVGMVLRMLSVPLRTADWQTWVGTFNGIALLTLAALPVAALVAWALARRRRRTLGTTAAWRRSLAEVGTVYGTVPWVWVTMLPGSGAGVVPGRLSLVPLQDLVTMGTGGIIGNLLVFAALGALAPLRFAALRSVPRVLALAAGCSVLIEVTQYVLRLDRVSSVDDVLLNAAGAGLAALVSRPWWRSLPRAAGTGPRAAPAT